MRIFGTGDLMEHANSIVRFVGETLAVKLVTPALTLLRWGMVKLFPNWRISRLLQSWEIKLLRFAPVTWIHEAHALKMINAYDFVEDQIREQIDVFDASDDPIIGVTIVPNRQRIQHEMSEYGESVPKHILNTFVKQNPLATKRGIYNRQALAFWLEEYQRDWDRMLEAN